MELSSSPASRHRKLLCSSIGSLFRSSILTFYILLTSSPFIAHIQKKWKSGLEPMVAKLKVNRSSYCGAANGKLFQYSHLMAKKKAVSSTSAQGRYHPYSHSQANSIGKNLGTTIKES